MTDGAKGRRLRRERRRVGMQKEARHRESARAAARQKEAEAAEVPHGAGEPGGQRSWRTWRKCAATQLMADTINLLS